MNRIADGITEGVIVSIGSFRGQMDCAIALHAHVPVICVDPRRGWVGEAREFGDVDRPFWMHNIMSLNLASKVRPIELPSHELAKIWTQPIGLLWIDGDHTRVAEDLEDWMPFVIFGGTVACHDSNSPMVIKAVTEREDLVEIERTDLTTVYRKEALYDTHTYDNLTLLVRKGPYEHDDRYVLGEVRSYDLGPDEVRTAIDVGGHIGAFTAWLKQLNPDAQIVAVEPERSNLHVLKINVDFPGVTVFDGIVRYDDAPAMLAVNPINSGCHTMVNADKMYPGQSAIPVENRTTLEEIMATHHWTKLDLLKLDCEGAEVDILTRCSDELLRNTRRIVGEFHAGYDHFWNGLRLRLESLGFTVTAETNPAAHATFLAINTSFRDDPVVELPDLFTEDEPEQPKRKGGRPKKNA